jgi:hypothetical protein
MANNAKLVIKFEEATPPKGSLTITPRIAQSLKG